jgi:hypothetical protein
VIKLDGKNILWRLGNAHTKKRLSKRGIRRRRTDAEPMPFTFANLTTNPLSSTLILFVPGHRLPQLYLVAVRIHNPGKFAVFVRIRAANDLDALLF